MSNLVADDWPELPLLLKVEEAARVLRIGRSKAYEMTTGRIVQLIPRVTDASQDTTSTPKPSRARRSADRAQLSLLGSD